MSAEFDPPARNCHLPRDLYYDPPNHVWVRPEGEDLYTLGVTDVGQTLAGELLFCEPKAVGTELGLGQVASRSRSSSARPRKWGSACAAAPARYRPGASRPMT